MRKRRSDGAAEVGPREMLAGLVQRYGYEEIGKRVGRSKGQLSRYINGVLPIPPEVVAKVKALAGEKVAGLERELAKEAPKVGWAQVAVEVEELRRGYESMVEWLQRVGEEFREKLAAAQEAQEAAEGALERAEELRGGLEEVAGDLEALKGLLDRLQGVREEVEALEGRLEAVLGQVEEVEGRLKGALDHLEREVAEAKRARRWSGIALGVAGALVVGVGVMAVLRGQVSSSLLGALGVGFLAMAAAPVAVVVVGWVVSLLREILDQIG